MVQWEALVGANRYRGQRPEWLGRDPDLGALEPDLLGLLCEILGRHTPSPERCFFGIWEGGHTKGELVALAEGDDASDVQTPLAKPLPPAFTPEEFRLPLLPLPPFAGREYVVLSGSLQSAPGLFDLTWFSMIWPTDRAWFVATDIDFDSTLVGGAERLIEEILSTTEFEVFPVGPDDSLTWDADPINPLPKDDS